MREALDGIDMDIKNKMQETTDTLLGQINENVKRNSEGKHTYSVQIHHILIKTSLVCWFLRLTCVCRKIRPGSGDHCGQGDAGVALQPGRFKLVRR